MRKRAVFVWAFALGSSVWPIARADSTSIAAAIASQRAFVFTLGLDLEEARKALEEADPEVPEVAIERGRLAIYEGDCDAALLDLTRPEVAKTEAGEMLGELARGCARVTAATRIFVDHEHALEVRYQDEEDAALGPLLADTVVAGRDMLSRELGVTWPKPTRFVVVRDHLSLSAMTGLPYRAAQTTGTVAVAKWGRVTLLSPRATHHGYAWRDTVVHELTHLAITRATRDRAPLWVQEGIAKHQEARWRTLGPFDDRPSPDAVAARGVELGLALALDKLGPSIAMLPSADQAMVAFAEVTSFVKFLVATQGNEVLPRLLGALREGASIEDAMQTVTGADLATWDKRWRVELTKAPKGLSSLFGLAGGGADHRDLRDVRDRARLAELLLARGHGGGAILELDRLRATALDDPSVRRLRGAALETMGRPDDVRGLVANPAEVLSSFAPWWALRGRWARRRGDEGVAVASFVEAVAQDPFGLEGACEGNLADSRPLDLRSGPLCEASRRRGELLYGGD
ncbi:MAG: hypothetical protein WCI05_18615 [Myxococcales bacterium]